LHWLDNKDKHGVFNVENPPERDRFHIGRTRFDKFNFGNCCPSSIYFERVLCVDTRSIPSSE